MKDIVFLDTETTGNDLLNDRLFQVCYKHGDEIIDAYFKPPVPISIKSQSITHVTPKMIEDKEPFEKSDMKKILSDLLSENIMVAHNAAFDIAMLEAEGLTVPRFICTLKVARALDTEGVIPEYNMQYLRYYLELNVDANAHEAKDDVLVLEAIFQRLYKKMMDNLNDHDAVISEMIKISSLPSLFKVFPFGKHKGKRIDEAVAIDRSYVSWLLEQKLLNQEGDLDWIFTLKHHLGV